MTAEALTPDQMTRALDYVVAVADSDVGEMERLESNGRPPMRYLLADVMHLMVRSVAAAEEYEGHVPQDRQDHAAVLGGILLRALSQWAESAEPDTDSDGVPDYHHASAGIARAVADYVLATFTGADGDLTGRLEPFRAAWSTDTN
ncbi:MULTISPECIES: hypothetical protein [unclassified Streptomyces]|uniref:hypothetical protein n=1 Tax=unclassified Streptomyces TaxID=2593676 RepID=UPI002258C62C|nr:MULTISPECIES: hypothetical protein [unclassified Streptomyces]MCX4871110.1 hypothetical protein [Streptomyces sp. NBC_00906]MCX4902732.1 hypothetical protein [Streptomyces sp. NBC_00892]